MMIQDFSDCPMHRDAGCIGGDRVAEGGGVHSWL